MATGIPVAVGELIDVATINSWARGYFRKNTSKTVNTTTTATDLFNAEFTLPAGAMATDKILRVTAWGDFKQATGSAKDLPRFQAKLGGTTVFDTGNMGASVCSNFVGRLNWRFQYEIQNLAAANSQHGYLKGVLGYDDAGFGGSSVGWTTGNGCTYLSTFASVDFATYEGGTSGLTIDTTAACAVVFNVINSNNGANYETKLFGALVEII